MDGKHQSVTFGMAAAHSQQNALSAIFRMQPTRAEVTGMIREYHAARTLAMMLLGETERTGKRTPQTKQPRKHGR